VLAAEAAGTDVLNHAQADAIRTEGDRAVGVAIRDRLGEQTLDVDGRVVVNAAGPWADEITADLTGDRLVRPAKGIHIVVPELTDDALAVPTTDDRVVFVVPWNGKSLVGTTDTDYEGDPGEAAATADDVRYLLDELEPYFPDLSAEDVMYTYAGVRPLFDSGAGTDSADVSRAHEVVDHDHEGLYSLVGAKITPYRQAAEELTDTVAESLGVGAPCRTAELPLPGAQGGSSSTAPEGVDVDHLQGLYGSRIDAVLERIERDETLAEPLCEHTADVLAQVTVAVEAEHARTVTDVMLRRCTVAYEACEGRDAVETVAAHMADLLDWSADHERREIEEYRERLARRHQWKETDAVSPEP
jgi:glycerol-3-phosphate dehydrogenase